MMWLAWLSKNDGNSMKRESILLVPSRVASQLGNHERICEIAAATFGEARCFVPEGEYEKGWPGACNFMFKEALEHIEHNFPDDMFLLEPDAIPLCPSWYKQIKKEWGMASKALGFMGRKVHYKGHPPHMSGIGVYGRHWRKYAPKLSEVQDTKGWDTFAADQIVPNAHFTGLIQHVWWNPVVSLEMIEETAVIFHQDKAGALIGLIDQKLCGGEADKQFNYSQVGKEKVILPMKCYFTHNANRVIKAPGYDFRFEKTEIIGGAWQGVYATQDEAEIAALTSAVAANIGVTEITQEEYEKAAKKKLTPRIVSVVTPPEGRPMQINQSPAVLVENPVPSHAKPENNEGNAAKPVESIDEVLKVDTVTMADGPVRPRRQATDVGPVLGANKKAAKKKK